MLFNGPFTFMQARLPDAALSRVAIGRLAIGRLQGQKASQRVSGPHAGGAIGAPAGGATGNRAGAVHDV